MSQRAQIQIKTGNRTLALTISVKRRLRKVWFDVSCLSSIKYYWRFDSLDDMVTYFQLLFGIDNASDEAILKGITNYLRYTLINNEYCLNWELIFYRAVKR